MAYANIDDVNKLLDPDERVPAEEEDKMTVLLEEATDLIIGYLEREYTEEDEDEDGVPDDVPGAVRRVAARVALRGLEDDPANPGAEAEINLMGPFSHTINWSKEYQGRSLYLTAGEELRLDRYKGGYTGGVTHVPMSGACGVSWYRVGYQ